MEHMHVHMDKCSRVQWTRIYGTDKLIFSLFRIVPYMLFVVVT